MGTETYHHLKAVIKKKYGQDACNVGDEGGFAPNILSNFEGGLFCPQTRKCAACILLGRSPVADLFFSSGAGLDLVKQAIEKAGYTGKIKIGMDVAASEFCKEGFKYDLDFKNPNSNPAEWVSESVFLVLQSCVTEKSSLEIKQPVPVPFMPLLLTVSAVFRPAVWGLQRVR